MSRRLGEIPALDADSLQAFLAHPDRPPGTLTYHELQGFLFTVACAPEPIRPSEWLPIVFGEAEAGYADLDEAKAVLGQLMALYNAINASVRSDDPALPPDCTTAESPMDNFGPSAPLAQWSRGFSLGHQWLMDLWDEVLPAGALADKSGVRSEEEVADGEEAQRDSEEEEGDPLGALMMVLSFFSSREIAEAFVAELGPAEQSLQEMAASMHRLVPTAVAEYAALGVGLSEIAWEAHQPVRVAKTGRNDPCPCGSGKKFKKCCGSSVH